MAETIRKSWIAGGMVLALSACQMGAQNGPVTEGASADAQPSAGLSGRDVEAPEVYQTSEKALWDGRPSLGGVWVASPDAKNPERVIMRNPANGKFVVGGLFQRDASMPGPKLQLSSDAADALGLVAGQPAVIQVTALTRDDKARTPDAGKPLPDGEAADTTDVTATAAAAIDKATATTAPAKASAAAPAATSKPAAKPAATDAAAPVTAAPLDTAAPTKPAATASAPAKPNAAAQGSLIQIGIFSAEPNAKRASDLLKKAGITSTMTNETSHDKPLWSVTTRGDAALLAKIKAAGFKDAYVMGH